MAVVIIVFVVRMGVVVVMVIITTDDYNYISVQGLKSCSEEMRADDDYMALLWQHEVLRVFKDRITRSSDMKWFDKNLKNILKEVCMHAFPAIWR